MLCGKRVDEMWTSGMGAEWVEERRWPMAKVRFVFFSVLLLLVLWVSSQLMGVTASQGGSALSVSLHVASSSDGSYTVTGSPTISAEFIDRVLSAYGSPAAGTGHQLSDLGVQY